MQPSERPFRREGAESAGAFPAHESGQPPQGADVDGPAPGTAPLQHERDQLQHAMESRPVVDMACGVVMATFGCTPEDAWDILVAISQHAHVKLRKVAEAVTATATGQSMPAELQEHLAKAVQAWRADRDHT
ncbi:ANTAR domain-containing protein [Streptomyces cadmiisoli]|uniref:ANTAR domain-containing protein n=1 Tax=Streptomyces cadmiisoli TaxID=2184053 RepID=UPI00365E6804